MVRDSAVSAPDALACAVVILATFVSAGFVHVLWLRSRYSARFGIPIDGYRTFRGKRFFGDNKTVRGFVAMIPAAGGAFLILGLLRTGLPDWLYRGTWPLSPLGYGALGLWAGLGFMLGELPNSFIKRQFDIAPGNAPAHSGARILCFVVDRIDSIIGMLVALSLVVPVPWRTWLYVLLFGPGIHGLFSVLLYRLRLKSRPA